MYVLVVASSPSRHSKLRLGVAYLYLGGSPIPHVTVHLPVGLISSSGN